MVLELKILKSHNMTEKNDIQKAVTLLKKDETRTNTNSVFKLFCVVITFCVRFFWLITFSLLTLLNQISKTFKNYFRLSIRFLIQNILKMIKFSFSNFILKDTKVDQAFYQAFSYISIITTLTLPNY